MSTLLPSALVLRPQKKHHWVLGSGKATKKLGAAAGDINPSGDWSKFDPTPELQQRYGLETQNCTVFAWLKAIIALARFKGYEIPHNLSERYTGITAGTTPSGNDPWKVIESIATQFGVVADEVLPWSDGIRGWADYYSPNPMDELIVKLGQDILRKYELEPEWVIPPINNFTPAEKQERIRAALKRGPVVASVRAWEKTGKFYTKDVGAPDNHLVWLPKAGEVSDQYEPFKKKLAPDYDHDAAIVLFMRPNASGIAPFERSYLAFLIDKAVRALRALLPLLNRPKEHRVDMPVQTPPAPVLPPPEPVKAPLSWEVPKEAFKLTRIMCDELGLTYEQKNILCACIYQESGFKNRKADGSPIINQNADSSGKVWSTDYGICQVNDYWHIGRARPSPRSPMSWTTLTR
jgi:hypothetical protein